METAASMNTVNMVVSFIIFVIAFILILTEKLHRTIAGFLGAVAMIIAGHYLNFYSWEKAIENIDFETIGLLLGMMISTSILEKTGYFQYLAIFMAKKSKGQPWKLMVILGAVTSVVSMFLDNVTTVVLIGPVTLLIAEILDINPIPLLLSEALLSNIGGVGTLVGDPPNIIIGTQGHYVFNDFLWHTLPVVVVVWFVSLWSLKFFFKKELSEKPKNIEALMKMDEKEALKDKKAANKVLIALGIVVFLFLAHPIFHLPSALVAIFGATLSLVLVRPNLDEVLKDVEWSVLLFFATLFIIVGGLKEAGVLHLAAVELGKFAHGGLLFTSILIIWVSAIISAIVDNIPFTIAMAPIIIGLGQEGINVHPLWWALALGVGFGGNGTPIGASANVVVVSLSEKTKTPITTKTWFKTGLPTMILTCIVATILFIIMFKMGIMLK